MAEHTVQALCEASSCAADTTRDTDPPDFTTYAEFVELINPRSNGIIRKDFLNHLRRGGKDEPLRGAVVRVHPNDCHIIECSSFRSISEYGHFLCNGNDDILCQIILKETQQSTRAIHLHPKEIDLFGLHLRVPLAAWYALTALYVMPHTLVDTQVEKTRLIQIDHHVLIVPDLSHTSKPKTGIQLIQILRRPHH